MSDIRDKYREEATVFVNGRGLKATRIPDLVPAQCIDKQCGARCYVESPVDAMHCVKCGRAGLRVSKFATLEPFLVDEPRGEHHARAMFRIEGDDETNDRDSGKE